MRFHAAKLLLLLFTLAAGVSLLRPAVAAPTVFDDTSALYAKSCAACHGGDGRGQTTKGKRLNATDFTSAKWKAKAGEAKLIRSITNGQGAMPDFKKTYDAEQIKALAAYVRNF